MIAVFLFMARIANIAIARHYFMTNLSCLIIIKIRRKTAGMMIVTPSIPKKDRLFVRTAYFFAFLCLALSFFRSALMILSSALSAMFRPSFPVSKTNFQPCALSLFQTVQ